MSDSKVVDKFNEFDTDQSDVFTKMNSAATIVNSSNNIKDLRRIDQEMKRKPDLSKHLRALMEQSKISSTQLSKECLIPASTLSTYLSGKKASYSPDHLAALADYFSVSLDYLMFGETSGASSLNSLLTEQIFDGYLKVKVERVIPNSKKDKGS